jgi:hypothetical protein
MVIIVLRFAVTCLFVLVLVVFKSCHSGGNLLHQGYAMTRLLLRDEQVSMDCEISIDRLEASLFNNQQKTQNKEHNQLLKRKIHNSLKCEEITPIFVP